MRRNIPKNVEAEVTDFNNCEIRRRKDPTFSQIEKKILLELVDERKSILETRESTSKMIVLKQTAWHEIEAAFNAREETVNRSQVKLRKAWENIKFAIKKETSAVKSPTEKHTRRSAKSNAKTTLICNIHPSHVASLSNSWNNEVIAKPEPIEPTEYNELSNMTENIEHSGHSIPNSIPKDHRSMDPYSEDITMEQDERDIRMKILQQKLELQYLKVSGMKRKMIMDELEHNKRVELLDLQLAQESRKYSRNQEAVLSVPETVPCQENGV